jgi:predicted small secreted protein
MKLKVVILPLLALSVLLLSGCGNTIEGVGKDFEEWGKTLQNTF